MTDTLANALGISSVVTPIEKKETPKGDADVLRSNALNSEVDPFESLYETDLANGKIKIIKPPFNPMQLYRMVQQNNTLNQCVAAMEVNIDGTGFQIVKENGDATEENDKTAKALTDFFSEPYPDTSLVSMRRELRRDLESCGNAYIEVLRNGKKEITVLNRLDAKYTRLVRLGDPVVVERVVSRNNREEKVRISIRERRYAQIVGTRTVYFKDYGSQQKLDKTDGVFKDEVPPEHEATEVIHLIADADVDTPYGVPRWINQVPSVLGSRKAEEFNLEFFDHGGLPPAMIMVQGGQFSKESRDDLTKYLAGKAKFKQRAVIVEAFGVGGDINSAGSVKVNIERFGAERQNDSMFEGYDDRCSQRVRGGFRLPPLFLGLAQDYNFACYDERTETLTDQGWKTRDQYRPGMKVAQVCPETGVLSFVRPQALSVYAVQDVEMYHYHSQTTDVMVTPKHRMLWRDMRKGDWRVTPVEDMNSRVQFRTTVEYQDGYEIGDFELPFVKPMGGPKAPLAAPVRIPAPEFLSLIGWVVSDGHVAPNSYVAVTQHKDRHYDELLALQARMPHGINTYILNEDKDVPQVCFSDLSLHRWFKDNVGKGLTKRLPEFVMGLCSAQLQIVFDALMKGDGHISEKGAAYTTISKRLADQVQEIALKLGYRAKQIVSAAGSFGDNPTYRVLLTKREVTDIYPQNLSRELYSGKVHCFTVPSGVYVTRRNGCVAIQGNTAYTAYMVAEAQVFQPERTEFDDMINVKLMKELAPEYKFKSLPLTVKDVETQLKAMRLVKDSVHMEDIVSAVNDLANLSLEYKEPEEAPEGPAPAPGNETLQGPEVQAQQQSETVDPVAVDGNAPTSIGKIMKMDNLILQELAADWAEHLSGAEFSKDDVQTMQGLMKALSPSVRSLFDHYVGVLTANPQFDREGVAELLACAGECDYDHTV